MTRCLKSQEKLLKIKTVGRNGINQMHEADFGKSGQNRLCKVLGSIRHCPVIK
jgi:hypothetical protein